MTYDPPSEVKSKTCSSGGQQPHNDSHDEPGCSNTMRTARTVLKDWHLGRDQEALEHEMKKGCDGSADPESVGPVMDNLPETTCVDKNSRPGSKVIPPTVEIETRADSRILPVKNAKRASVVESRTERLRGQLFGQLDRPPEQELPLLPDGRKHHNHRVPLLELCDAAGLPVRNPGHGAPLDLRLLIRANLSVRQEDFKLSNVRLALRVRELHMGLWPSKFRLAQHWPKLAEALMRAHNYHIPDGHGGRWFPLALVRLPVLDHRKLPHPDDMVVFDLRLPKGATTGPMIDLPVLDRMGMKSGPAYRAYIAASTLTWRPGVTRRPNPEMAGRFGWSRNLDDYPVLTLDELRWHAFGPEDRRNNRTKAAILKPWQDLPGFRLLRNQRDRKTGITGWRIVPAVVATIILPE